MKEELRQPARDPECKGSALSRMAASKLCSDLGHGSALGQQHELPPPEPNARYLFGQATFAGMRGNERDAPIADVPALASERGVSTHCRRSSPRQRLVGSAMKRTFTVVATMQSRMEYARRSR